MGSPESLLSKDPLYQKIAKFAPTKLLMLKFTGKPLGNRQVCMYVLVQHDHIVLDSGEYCRAKVVSRMPLEPGATAFASAVLKGVTGTVQGV